MKKYKNYFLLTLLAIGLGITSGESKSESLFESTLLAQTIENGWAYTSFRAEGLDPTRFESLKAQIHDGIFRKVDGIVVVLCGKILIEEYFNGYDRDTIHEIRWARQSIGS